MKNNVQLRHSSQLIFKDKASKISPSVMCNFMSKVHVVHAADNMPGLKEVMHEVACAHKLFDFKQ